MTVSSNGWPASGNPGNINVGFFSVAGCSFPGGVRRGDVATVLSYVAQQFHNRVERLVPGWNWGYNYRLIIGRSTVSNHGSGTAIDINAPRHPLGVYGTFSAGQRATIHSIMAACSGVVRWGGDYSGRKDEMHFEINASAAAVAVVAQRIRGAPIAPSPAPAPVLVEEDDEMVKFVHGNGPAPWNTYVYKIEYAHDGPQIAVRTHVPNANEPGFKIFIALGGKVQVVDQKTLDTIPFKPGTAAP